jgi:hypothetical protein
MWVFEIGCLGSNPRAVLRLHTNCIFLAFTGHTCSDHIGRVHQHVTPLWVGLVMITTVTVRVLSNNNDYNNDYSNRNVNLAWTFLPSRSRVFPDWASVSTPCVAVPLSHPHLAGQHDVILPHPPISIGAWIEGLCIV